MASQMSRKRVVVIGGVNTDICGTPTGKLLLKDSNPGSITVKPGGVARNIAHNLCLLGLEVSLIAPIGGDMYGSGIIESCTGLGMDMSMSPVLREYRSSVYLYVTDETGDMCVGINDMGILKRLTPEYLKGCMDRINSADAVVLDANLEPETVRYIAENCTASMYADPVSAAKAERLRPVIDKLTALKPNMLEAQLLTGEDKPENAARALLDAGVKQVFISLGGKGMYAADKDGSVCLPRVEARTVNTTGAGDAAAAAIVWAGVNGCPLEQSARAAVRAGALTVSCNETNSPDLCPAALRD